MWTIDQLPIGDRRLGDAALGHEVGQIGDSCAAVEAIVSFLGVARQVLGADPMVGVVEPNLQVGKQHLADPYEPPEVLAFNLVEGVVAIGAVKSGIALRPTQPGQCLNECSPLPIRSVLETPTSRAPRRPHAPQPMRQAYPHCGNTIRKAFPALAGDWY